VLELLARTFDEEKGRDWVHFATGLGWNKRSVPNDTPLPPHPLLWIRIRIDFWAGGIGPDPGRQNLLTKIGKKFHALKGLGHQMD
jgi:hypothetical protein